VLGAILSGRAGALLFLVGPPAGLFAGLARGGRGRPDGVGSNATATDGLCQLLELVGSLIDRLKVSLVLVLTARRGDIRVPALGHPAAGKLHATLIKRRIQLEEEHRLFDIEDPWHDSLTVAAFVLSAWRTRFRARRRLGVVNCNKLASISLN
jgi:hypothetical protein